MKVLVAAAGTGGHINPGIAIANEIKRKNPDSEIIFVGTKRGLENDLVPRAGYRLETIEVYGISREISFNNLKKMIKTIKGFGEARKLVKKIKPDLVIGTGGYICGPIGLAATKNKIPTILHESNAFPGVTVKMLSKKVDSILVGFEDAKERLPKAKRVVVTGNPAKMKKKNISKEEIEKKKQEQGLDGKKPLVLVFGGSQGARAINQAMLDIIENKKNTNYSILWAAGPKQYDNIKGQLQDKNIDIQNIKDVKILPYIYDMEEVMNLADLVICRSGAMTITEVAIAGKPAIFIPLPTAAENHQEYNAKVLEKQGAARIIHDKELTNDFLNQNILEMIADKEKLEEMGKKALKVAMTDVEKKIYMEIENVMKRKG